MRLFTWYRKLLALGILCVKFFPVSAQTCSVPSQTPVSSIFVCGTEAFHLTTTQFCGASNVPTPCPTGFNYQNTNPHFLRFACSVSGTLGFKITPDDLNANFNWQLFDVSGTNPDDIFTNPSLFVDCNWSDEPGETGASSDGTVSSVCAGPGQPLFNKMINIVAGRTYLMMVNNQSGIPGGYEIIFGGGTAVITDPIDPRMTGTNVSCDGKKIVVEFNKQIRCNSIAPDGSDFSVSGGPNVIGAIPQDCSTPFGTLLVTILLDQSLPYGNHTLTLNTGNDGNTLLDICTRNIPVGSIMNVTSAPAQPTPMTEIRIASCSPDYMELVFSQPILCASIAADGSDFIISGPQTITATPVLTTCNSGLIKTVRLNFTGSVIGGNYSLQLVRGADGNTVFNDCDIETPPGSSIPFTTYGNVSAAFSSTLNNICSGNTIGFSHDGLNNVNSWSWDFGNGTTSNNQYPVVQFEQGDYNVKLTVSNGPCSDTKSTAIKISRGFEAGFEAPSMLCPGDPLLIKDTSNGNIDEWKWDFGNGITSTLQEPVGISYASIARDELYTIKLIITNNTAGCRDTATKVVKVLAHCTIAVPTAFTPNGDGKNDFLYPLNALKADQLEFRVFNRMGQQVFFTRDWTRKWDGTIKGVPQPTGVYAWLLSYTFRDTGQKILTKGTVLLLR